MARAFGNGRRYQALSNASLKLKVRAAAFQLQVEVLLVPTLSPLYACPCFLHSSSPPKRPSGAALVAMQADASRMASASTSSAAATVIGTDNEKKEADIRDPKVPESFPARLRRRRHTSEIADAIDPPTEDHLANAESLASINGPPSESEVERGSIQGDFPPSKVYTAFSIPVLTSLAPASVLGALARLGLESITTYDGRAIFPLAWAQAAGCLIMGFALGLKDQIGGL